MEEEEDGALGQRISHWPQGLKQQRRDEAEQQEDPGSMLSLSLKLERSY